MASHNLLKTTRGKGQSVWEKGLLRVEFLQPDFQFRQAEPHEDVFEFNERDTLGHFVHLTRHIAGKHVASARAKGRVLLPRILVLTDKPLVMLVPNRKLVQFQEAGEKLSGSVFPEEQLGQVVDVDKHVRVRFHHERCLRTEAVDPLDTHHGLQGQVEVGVHEVLLDNVVMPLAFLRNNFRQILIGCGSQKEEGFYAFSVHIFFLPPRVPDDRASKHLFMGGGHQQDKERGILLAVDIWKLEEVPPFFLENKQLLFKRSPTVHAKIQTEGSQDHQGNVQQAHLHVRHLKGTRWNGQTSEEGAHV